MINQLDGNLQIREVSLGGLREAYSPYGRTEWNLKTRATKLVKRIP